MSLAAEARLDSLFPQEMAVKAEEIGVKKANLDAVPMFVLAVLAGAFIALGPDFATTVSPAAGCAFPYGVTRLLAGLVFSLGLSLVVVGGAELFTGNNLIVMAWASRKVSTARLLRHWGIVYLGNFAGAGATAVLVFLSGQYTFGGGAIGRSALAAAPVGLLIKAAAPEAFWASIGQSPAHYPDLTWGHFLVNTLLPVTIGNILGGAFLVGAIYWFIFLRKSPVPADCGAVKANE